MNEEYAKGVSDEPHEEILARLAIADCLTQRPNARRSDVLKTVEKTLRAPMRYRGKIELREGLLYDVTRKIELPDTQIIQCVRPKLIIAHTALAEELKRFPEAVYKLTPRQFEILIAEILTDKGWDVHLTPETRDGGVDILAYTHSPDIGKVLCLVEVKRYQPHRKVGLGIVRQLHGAYTSHGATKGMLVTTSTFTAPAREHERRHENHLTLREYNDVAKWIRDYGGRRN